MNKTHWIIVGAVALALAILIPLGITQLMFPATPIQPKAESLDETDPVVQQDGEVATPEPVAEAEAEQKWPGMPAPVSAPPPFKAPVNADVGDDARAAIAAAKAMRPAGEFSQAEFMSRFTFEPVEGFIRKRKGIAPLRELTAADRQIPMSKGVARYTAAPGWTFWLVRHKDPENRVNGAMFWMSDGSPAIELNWTYRYDNEIEIPTAEQVKLRRQPKSGIVGVFVARSGVKPAEVFSFNPGKRIPYNAEEQIERGRAILAELPGKALSYDMIKSCWAGYLREHALSQTTTESPAMLTLLRYALLMDDVAQIKVNKLSDHEWEYLAENKKWTMHQTYAAELLAQADHPSAPGVILEIETIEPAAVMFASLGPKAHARLQTGLSEPVNQQLKWLTLEAEVEKYVWVRNEAPAAAVLKFVAQNDADLSFEMGMEFFQQANQGMRWASAMQLHRSLLASNKPGAKIVPNEGLIALLSSDTSGVWTKLKSDWPTSRLRPDDPRVKAMSDAVAGINDHHDRCVIGLYLLLDVAPDGVLKHAIDLLQANKGQPISLVKKMPYRGIKPERLQGESLLAACVATGYRAGIDRLAKMGFKLNLDTDPRIALDQIALAVQGGDTKLVQHLLKAGGDKLIEADPNQPAAMITHAAAFDAADTIKLLDEQWPGAINLQQAFITACKDQRGAQARVFFDQMHRDEKIKSDLFRAVCVSGDPELADQVIDRYSATLRSSQNMKWPFREVLEIQDLPMLKMLLDNGASATDVFTPLVRASQTMDTEKIGSALKMLVDYGFKIDEPINKIIGTPMSLAFYNNSHVLAKAMLERGADPNPAMGNRSEHANLLDAAKAAQSNPHIDADQRRTIDLIIEYNSR